MSRVEKNKERGIQIGISSLILVFTVLCLVVFCTLSLTSAKADYSLAKKNEESVRLFYQADGKAEETKAEVNRAVIEAAGKSSNEEQFGKTLKSLISEDIKYENNLVKFKVDTTNGQMLCVELELYPYEKISVGQENYSIKTWKIENSEEYKIDESISVWGGGFDD